MKPEESRYEKYGEEQEPVPESQARYAGARAAASERPMSLIPDGTAAEFSRRWQEVQYGFVDDPRSAVEQAEKLVSEALDAINRTFAKERAGLEEQWKRGEQPAETEQLRLSLQRFRSFFQRLLSGSVPESETRSQAT